MSAVSAQNVLVSRKAFGGKAVRAATRPSLARRVNTVQVQAASKQEVMSAAVTTGVASMMLNPLVADASSVTPSLKNLLLSVVAGGTVLIAIVVAVTTISGFDRIRE